MITTYSNTYSNTLCIHKEQLGLDIAAPCRAIAIL